MKIYSWNVNGIRSASTKGLLDFIKEKDPDVLCLQEIKANTSQFPDEIRNFGYHLYVNSAQKPGYAGVAIFSKLKPKKAEEVFGMERFDLEGRLLKITFADFTLINFYLPHGGRQKENLPYKLDVYKKLFNFLADCKKTILVGDFNIAHKECDLARPKNNQKNIMFTPEERVQLDKLESLGFIDTFREFNKANGNYTWWPYMHNARERNLGWRIDYVFISNDLKPALKDAFILPEVRGSDHCPIGIEI